MDEGTKTLLLRAEAILVRSFEAQEMAERASRYTARLLSLNVATRERASRINRGPDVSSLLELFSTASLGHDQDSA